MRGSTTILSSPLQVEEAVSTYILYVHPRSKTAASQAAGPRKGQAGRDRGEVLWGLTRTRTGGVAEVLGMKDASDPIGW